MALNATTTRVLARCLGIPRQYAVGLDGRWSRRHENVDEQGFHHLLNTGAVCVAVKNTAEDGSYSDYQQFAIYDIDNRENFDDTKVVALEIHGEIARRGGHNPFITFSGSKGFHIWVFFDAPLHQSVVLAWQKSVLDALHYERAAGADPEWMKGTTHIETLIANGQGKIIKAPFSAHPGRPGFHEIPIGPDEILAFDPNTPPTEAMWRRAEELAQGLRQTDVVNVLIEVPQDAVAGDAATLPRRRQQWRDTPGLPMGAFVTPPTATRQDDIKRKIVETPCLRICDQRAKSLDGIYTERAILVQALSATGYKREEIAVYIRDNINDAEDNANVGELERQIAYWFTKRGRSCCRILQDQSKYPGVCPGPCGRPAPHFNETPIQIDIPPVDPRPVPDIFDDVIESKQNTAVTGTTRIGKTTSCALAAARASQKTAILVPRLSIVDMTGVEILRIGAEQGLQIKAAMLPDNRISCLRLAQKIELLHRQFGDVVAFEMLKRVEKPNCSGCPYEESYDHEIQPNRMYGAADLQREMCGRQTVLNNSSEWTQLWLTDKKFISIVQGIGEQYSTPTFNLLSGIQLYVLDEVSHFIETPAEEVDIYQLERADPTKEYRFVQQLQNDVRKLTAYLHSRAPSIFSSEEEAARWTELRSINETEEMVETFERELSGQLASLHIDEAEGTFVYERVISGPEREEMKKVGKHIIRSLMIKAEYDNEALNSIIDALDLKQELKWIFTNIPNEHFSTNISIKIAPKVMEYVGHLVGSGAQIITMDATPPVVPVDAIFNRPFRQVNLGDPQGTNRKTLLIPDHQHVRASALGEERNVTRADRWIGWALRLFGESKLGLLTSSIAKMRAIRDRFEDRYPNLDTLVHRGRRVTGVAYEKRAGVSLCAPYAPPNASHWLKAVYPAALRNITAKQLWMHEQARQTQQAEARFKDPAGRDRSVVVCFGQDTEQVRQSYLNAIEPPHIANIIDQVDGEECPVQLVQAKWWVERGEVLEDDHDLKAVAQLLRMSSEIVSETSGVALARVQTIRAAMVEWGILDP